MARRSLLSALGGAGAFVCDTAPLVYRLERSPSRAVVAAVDEVFDAVESGVLACIVPAICAAEVLVRPYLVGPPAVSVVDAFLRSPGMAVAPPELGAAHAAARHVAHGTVRRLADAFIVAIAAELQLPLVTGERRLARATGGLLVHDFA